MKRTCVFFLVLTVFLGCSTSGNKNLIGTWEIVEFGMTGTRGNPVRTEQELRDAGQVWNIKFSSNGHFRQDFNMRQPDLSMEVEEGTWMATMDSILIELDFDTISATLPYSYRFEDDLLVLILSGEHTDASVVSKFRKK